jgi:hypothetical protein
MKIKKENLVFLIGMIVILGTHLVSCEKVPTPPVVDPELMPKLELSVTPQGEIPYGEVATLKWKTINALRVFVNDERQENYKEGNKGTGKLFKNTKFVVRATNVKLSTEETVEIEVGDWTTSTFGLVSYYPWRYDSLGRSSLDGKILKRWEVASELLSVTSNFHRDGRYINSDYPTVVLQWSVPDSNTIVINGSTRKLQVNQEQMIISYQTSYNGQPVWFDQIYRHASDTPTDPE